MSERTEVRILYDDEALYIGARMLDRQPRPRLGRRDMDMSASDWLTVIIDARHDHRTSFGFEVNPAGVRRDQTRSDSDEDDSWDPVWEVATSTGDSGWVAEMRIPFSQLRFSGEPVQRGGSRSSGRSRATRSSRSGRSRRATSRAARRATATSRGSRTSRPASGWRSCRTSWRAPSTSIAARQSRSATSEEYKVEAGVDLKYRVTSSLTLDATVNPDFGQVEVDPAVINLTAFETQFQEKRPFFIEGSELFRFGGRTAPTGCSTRGASGAQPALAPPYCGARRPDARRTSSARPS